MLSKSKTTKALLYSTAALSLFAASHVHADETSNWAVRSVDQIKADIAVSDNQQTYTVQYGDTLGSIAEAMGIDVNVLANINQITNIDLIYPGTVLTTTYNADNQAVSVKVETPASETSTTPVVAEANLTTNEVTVNGQSVVAADLTAPVETVSTTFTNMTANPYILVGFMIITVVTGFLVCSLGVQNGVEKITKVMMLALLALIILLAIHSMLLKGGIEGLKFYLVPDFNKVAEIGLFNVIVAAMNQAFFTLSLGIGAMSIFGSYIGKEQSLFGESIRVCILDTFVAIFAGLIIFPACSAFGVNADSGPSLIFVTLPNIFSNMAGGQLWGSLFFLFMSFAAFSTVIAVFEGIIACFMDMTGVSRKKSCYINIIIMIILSLPCALGFNILSGVNPLGAGSTILDLEDFLVSDLILPIGSLIYLLFCVCKNGWGWDNFIKEANTGKGIKLSSKLKIYLTYVLPLLIIFKFIIGLKARFF